MLTLTLDATPTSTFLFISPSTLYIAIERAPFGGFRTGAARLRRASEHLPASVVKELGGGQLGYGSAAAAAAIMPAPPPPSANTAAAMELSEADADNDAALNASGSAVRTCSPPEPKPQRQQQEPTAREQHGSLHDLLTA